MINLKGIKSFQLIEAILGVAWFIIMLLNIDFNSAQANTWFCLLLGVLSFLLVGIVIFFFIRLHNTDAIEVSALPIYFSGVYLLVAIIVDTVMLFLCKGTELIDNPESLYSLTLVINVILLFVYVVALIGAYVYIQRVDKSMNASFERKSMNKKILTKISDLKDLVKDAEVKKDLDMLHELVVYGSNITKDAAIEIENLIMDCLEETERMLLAGAEADALKEKVVEATNLWKKRNRC